MMNLKVLTVSAFKDKNEIAFGQYIIDMEYKIVLMGKILILSLI